MCAQDFEQVFVPVLFQDLLLKSLLGVTTP